MRPNYGYFDAEIHEKELRGEAKWRIREITMENFCLKPGLAP
jgi:hypothetical protein